jgi:hypothetical protein
MAARVSVCAPLGGDVCLCTAALTCRAYRWDYDNKLALELQEQQRDGDPDGEGIVWHRYAPSMQARVCE